MVPVGRGVQQEYQNMQQSFTCCVGTGMESHALHGDGIYYESDDTVWVTLFVPSTAQLAIGNATITQETSFPDGDTAKLTLTMPKPKEFTLAIRRPVVGRRRIHREGEWRSGRAAVAREPARGRCRRTRR